jgi:hypothetical protein
MVSKIIEKNVKKILPYPTGMRVLVVWLLLVIPGISSGNI